MTSPTKQSAGRSSPTTRSNPSSKSLAHTLAPAKSATTGSSSTRPGSSPGNSVDPTDSFTVQFEALRVWNGNGFINPGNETVTLTHANGTLELDSLADASFGLDYNDTELTWQLNGNDGANDPDRGVYLLEFIIADDDTGDASRPVYFAFDFESGYTPENPSYLSAGYDHSTHAASREYIFDNFIIPEPSSLALLGMGGLMLLRRRR